MASAIYLSLGILFLGLTIQISRKRFGSYVKRWTKFLFFSSAIAVLLYYIFLTVAQYFVWKISGPPFIYFLPPHESIFYLLNYHFIRFAFYYLISFGVALLFLHFTRKYNRKLGYRFFEDEEPYFGALSIFLLGNSNWYWGWVWYLAAVFLLSAAISFIRERFLNKKERLPLYHLWLPTAILVIIVQAFL